MFTPALKFTLFERFSSEVLEVSETMEMNGKRTFGYDVPFYTAAPKARRRRLHKRQGPLLQGPAFCKLPLCFHTKRRIFPPWRALPVFEIWALST